MEEIFMVENDFIYQPDPTLERRSTALSGMASSAGWDSGVVDSLSELMKIADERRAFEAHMGKSDWETKYRTQKEIDAEYDKKEKELQPDDSLSYVFENFGSKYLNAKTVEERKRQADIIQKYGLKAFLENSPLTDLMSENELEKREKATSLMNELGSMVSIIGSGHKNVQGVGPLGQMRPAWMTNAEGTNLKQLITNFTAQRMQEISGAAVSDEEVKRLGNALPLVGDSEKVIYDKANNILNSLQIGQELQELAKREDITIDQAYKKYGANMFSQRGMPVPDWLNKSGSNLGSDPNKAMGGFNIDSFLDNDPVFKSLNQGLK